MDDPAPLLGCVRKRVTIRYEKIVEELNYPQFCARMYDCAVRVKEPPLVPSLLLAVASARGTWRE